MKKIFLIFLMTFFLSVVAEAQVVVKRSKEIVMVGGVEYYMHHVKRGETLYGISKAYQVSVEEISRMNPEVNDGLQADMVIGIPVVENLNDERQSVQNQVENKTIGRSKPKADNDSYTVGRGENLYMIAKRCGVDLADFKALNPGLTNEPAEGTVIKMPSIYQWRNYLVHKVEFNEKVTNLLKRWNVNEDAFRALNPTVGSHVFSGQNVLIPLKKTENVENPVAVDNAAAEKPVWEIADIEENVPKESDANEVSHNDVVAEAPTVESSDDEVPTVQNQVEDKTVEPQKLNVSDVNYTVVHDETLYLIAKRFGIDLADFKALNPDLTNEPAEGTVIKVPSIRNDEEYLVHKVEMNEKTSNLLRKWEVDEGAFRALNPTVGSHVFSGQNVLIPLKKAGNVENPVAVDNAAAEKPAQEIADTEENVPKESDANEVSQNDVVAEAPTVESSDDEVPTVQNQVENKTVEPQKLNVSDGNYTVGRDENLYMIAKRFGIDLADFKALNPGLTNEPAEGTVIKVPSIRNDEEYLVHKVEMNEKTSNLLRKWEVDEDAFRALNPAVGAHVFAGQMVLIPIEKAEIIEIPVFVDDVVEEEPIAVEEEPIVPEESVQEPVIIVEQEPVLVSDCAEKSENAHERYKVALLIPLYLGEVDDIAVSPESVVKSRKSRPLSFLQFYEGFMIAIDSLTKHYGLRLDLTVIDVTENIGTAQNAVSQLEKNPVDLIVGPFFSKSFGVVQEYAKNHKTLIVNPLSTRESIVEGNPYVVKLKPNAAGQLPQLASLVNRFYGDSNVSIICQSSISESSSAYLDEMERLLNLAVNSEVMLKTEDFLRYAQNEARRQEMGSNLPSTIEVEGQIYATKDLKNGGLDEVRIENKVGRFVYNTSDLNAFSKNLSEMRNNLVIAYGNDNVFATQILNKLHKTAETRPITLVAMPDWSGLDKLLVENLLKMNAIYFNEGFVDYNSNEAKRFVFQFRRKYNCEPTDYAFSGFDVAWYFMNAFMRFGHETKDCLLNFEMPLLSNSYSFVKNASENGMENYQWSIYQYDNEKVELKLIDLSDALK